MTAPPVTSFDFVIPGSAPSSTGSAPLMAATLDVPGMTGVSRDSHIDDVLTALRSTGTPVAVAVHCFTCHRRAPGVFRISRELAATGIACLRFDLPGLGESVPEKGGATFRDTTFSSNINDIVAACQWLSEHVNAPSLLVGHSLGGAAVLHAARDIDSLSAVATVGAPFSPARAALSLLDAFDTVPESRSMESRIVQLSGRDMEFRRRFLTDLSECSNASAITDDISALGRHGVPLMVLHSPTDQTVPVTDAVKIFDAASWPKSLMSIPDADHLLTQRGSARRVGTTIATWALSVGITASPGSQRIRRN